MSYTVNLIPNPSFEAVDGTMGYTAVSSTLDTEYADALYGSNSMRVTTNGSQSGQGFFSPYVPELHPLDPNVYSGSLYLKGTEHIQVNIMLARNPGGVIILSKTITLTENWQRVTLPNGVTPTGVDNVYLIVQTVAAAATTFLVDGVQIEQNTVITEYCDGDQYGCYWQGDQNNSPSVREVRFAIETDGFGTSAGALDFLVPGEIFEMQAFGDQDISDGTLEFSTIEPVAAFDDFAIFPLTDYTASANPFPDPAMTYARQTNGGTLAGEYGQAFARQFTLFVPPRDYPVSGGYAWKRAQYAGVGFRYDNLPSGGWNYLDAVQLEPHKVDDTANYGPSDYETPRQIKTIVKPDRLNFVKNPSFETSLSGWVANNVTTTRDTTTVVPISGTASLKASIPDALAVAPGVYTSLDNLIVGRTYTVSAYVQGSSGLQDILVSCGNGTSSLTGNGVPYGGVLANPDDPDDPANIGYGEGPYGGMFASGDASNFPTGVWIRTHFTFTATDTTATLTFDAATTADATYPVSFWIDAVLVEEGEILQDYFDGSFGPDYLWESGGTPNLARSYYYEGRRAKVYIIDEIIKDNTPFGISAADPLYAVPYTQ